eukprot:6196696-Pleurochrysis_carterae.AAC.3
MPERRVLSARPYTPGSSIDHCDPWRTPVSSLPQNCTLQQQPTVHHTSAFRPLVLLWVVNPRSPIDIVQLSA